MARPPLQKARQTATAWLIEKHRDEFERMVDDALAAEGWGQREVTKKVWTKTP